MFEKVIRDSVHGDIYINEEVVYQIMNTPEMQRMRRILQLGGAQFAYPGASHTRFSHSIGVYHIVGMFLDAPGFKEVNEKDRILVKLAGLMHDFGHGPFSHTFEKITTKSHEDYTADIIRNSNGNIAPILKSFNIDPEEVIQIIEGVYPNKAVNLLVSSQLDADRLDYLMRDSYNCGVNYAALDIKWMVRHAQVIDDKIVFPKKLVYAIESYLLGRYHMYKQVYNHKLSIAFDAMFIVWFKRLKYLFDKGYQFKHSYIGEMFKEIFNKQEIPLEKYLTFDDYFIFEIFKMCAIEDDQILADLSDRLINRRIFAYCEFSDIKVGEMKTKLKEAGYNLDYYFISITPKQSLIYKDGIIDGKDERIYIQNHNKIQSIQKLSLLTDSIKEINEIKLEKKYLFPKEIV
ncbi:HD domain-containing protein [Mesoplasma syrphidae]|uniref:HD domain-containing protein n=1 Tax=Mesoplasma syrphidae TaxID=225999 RepID=A0A2K9BIT2_9MOLU|nr:HD domain-containing protein [Mesoplasma syrphidae]AUF83271.1 HD domain-containing protein [Mesoplasma syrphidae]